VRNHAERAQAGDDEHLLELRRRAEADATTASRVVAERVADQLQPTEQAAAITDDQLIAAA
jgi:hypothetical protein